MSRTQASSRLAVRDTPFSLINTTSGQVDLGTTDFAFENNEAFSFCAWAKIDAGVTGSKVLFGRRSGVGNFRGYDLLVQTDGTLRFALQSTGSNRIRITTKDAIPYSRYLRIWGTYDGSMTAAGTKVYVNGVEMNLTVNNDNLSTTIVDAGISASIGSRNAASVRWEGLHTNVLVYDREVSATEIASDYSEGTQPVGNLYAEYLYAGGSGTSLLDTSGNGRDGTISSLTWSEETPFSKRFAVRNYQNTLLGGSTNKTLVIPQFDPTGGSGATLSVATWIKMGTLTDTGVLISHADRGTSDRSWNISVSTGGALRYTASADGGVANYKQYDLASGIETDKHHLLGFTFNAGTLLCYLDGIDITEALTKTIDGTVNTLNASSADLLIGGQYNSGVIADTWDYLMGQSWIWSDVLTAQEWADLYNNGTVPQDNLQAAYLMSEGSGNSVADSSGNGNNATGTALSWSTDTVSKARTQTTAYRIPTILRGNYGVTDYWDFRTGFRGDNSAAVKDMLGRHHMIFNGSTALSSVYTSGEYTAQCTSTNNDNFRTVQEVQLSNSPITKFSALCYMDVDDTTASHVGIAHFDSTTGDVQRSFIVRSAIGGAAEFVLSNNGTSQASLTTDTSGLITAGGGMQAIVVTYDGTEAVAADRVKIYVDNNTPQAWSGTPGTSIFNVTAQLMLGAFLNASSISSSEMDGKLGIQAMAIGTTWSAAQVGEILTLTKDLGNF